MEFGNDPQPLGSPDIDEATRLEASSRLRIVSPAHAQVAPEDYSDDQIVTQHLVRPAVGNAANDTETTPGDAADNIAALRVHHVALTAAISASLLLSSLLIVAFFVIGRLS